MTDRRDPGDRALRAPRAEATTASARSSRSARIRAGAGRWCRTSRATAAACSTSRRAPASSPSGCSPQGHRVTGLDQSPDMLAVARRRFGDRVELVEASATAIPFPDASFDHLTFTYLLRYVDDPGATLAELARVVRPGGTIANLEFCVPAGHLAAALGPLRRRRPARARPHRLDAAGTTSAASSARRSAGSTSGGRSSASSSSGSEAGIARRAGPAHEPRRRRRDLGHAHGEAGVLRAAAGEAGATT